MRLNNYKLLIRSHTSCPDGYMANLGGKCITIFSVPKYIDDNKGACIAMWGQKNETLRGIVMQYSVSDQSAMDNQVFCSEALIQKFNSLDVQKFWELKRDPNMLKLFFVFLAAGNVEADIGSPRKCEYLVSQEDEKVTLPDELKSGDGL